MDHKFQNISQCWPKCWPSVVLPPRGPPAVFPGKNGIPLGTSMEFPPRGPPAVFSRQKRHSQYGVPPRGASGGFFPAKTTIPSKQVSILMVFVTFRSILTQILPKSTNQPINQPTSQSTNQTTNQPANQPTNQPIWLSRLTGSNLSNGSFWSGSGPGPDVKSCWLLY